MSLDILESLAKNYKTILVRWCSDTLSHILQELWKKNSEPAAIWMLVETTNVLNFWKEWKLHIWFFFCPFFVAIQNLHTSACNLHTKATFSVNITFRPPNFVNMHGKPMCMFGNLVFNISICVNFYRTQVSLGSGLWVPVSVTPRALVETLLMWLWLMMIPTQY